MRRLWKLCALLLAFALLLSLCACAKPEENQDDSKNEPVSTQDVAPESDEPTPETEEPNSETQETEEVWTPGGPVEAKVSTGYEGTSTITGSDDKEYTRSYSLPVIEMPGPYIEALNAEIAEFANKYSRSNITYEYYFAHQFLTVIVTMCSADGNTDSDSYGIEAYKVYTVDIEKCRLATAEEILAVAGLTWDEFWEKNIVAQMAEFYNNRYGYSFDGLSDEYQDEDNVREGTRVANEYAMETDYINSPAPFFGKDGSLYAFGYTYQIAGEFGYSSLVPLE